MRDIILAMLIKLIYPDLHTHVDQSITKQESGNFEQIDITLAKGTATLIVPSIIDIIPVSYISHTIDFPLRFIVS